MLYNLDTVFSVIEDEKRFGGDGQLGLFGDDDTAEPELLKIDEMPRAELLAMEKEATGLYLTGHPMDVYSVFVSRGKYAAIGDINSQKYSDGQRVSVAGILGALRIKQLKNNNILAYTTIEDVTGLIDVTAFSGVYSKYRELLSAGKAVIIRGKVSEREDRDAELIPESIELIPENAANMKRQIRAGLYLKIPSVNSPEFERIKAALKKFSGNTSVYIVCADNGKRLEAPKNLCVTVSDALIAALSGIIGDENVKLV